MMSSKPPTPGNVPERGLRRLRKALEVLLEDRAQSAAPRQHICYVDFSEVYAFAFKTSHDRPSDEFLGGRQVEEATSTWMLSAATHHLFNGWQTSPLRILPPHRAEMARELRRIQREGERLKYVRRRVVDLLPKELTNALANRSDATDHVKLLEAIMRGHLSTLCMELLERERDLLTADRCVRELRGLFDSHCLTLADDTFPATFEPAEDDLDWVERALGDVRQSDGNANMTDARALLFLREAVLAHDTRVRFVTRSVAIRRALNALKVDERHGNGWPQTRRAVRVPETILLDFLAGPDAEGNEWLDQVKNRIEQFLAQLDRALQLLPSHDDLMDISKRAWNDLIGVLNLRRSTRPDVPDLLRHSSKNPQTLQANDMAQIAQILSSNRFQSEMQNQISSLLDAIELAEWRIALELSSSSETLHNVVIGVRTIRGQATVSFASGSFQVSLRFAGEMRDVLRPLSSGKRTTTELAESLLQAKAAHSTHDAQSYLLLAAILGTAGHWSDAIAYCTRAVEGSGSDSTTQEALFFRGLCQRKAVHDATLESGQRAAELLRDARRDIEGAIARSKGRQDPRYLKELGTMSVVWNDLGLEPSADWTLSKGIQVLDAGRHVAEKAGETTLLFDILNNLCYACALASDARQVELGVTHLPQLEALGKKHAPGDVAVRDTILLLRARHAALKKDALALREIGLAYHDLVSAKGEHAASAETRRRHAEQVSQWYNEAAASGAD